MTAFISFKHPYRVNLNELRKSPMGSRLIWLLDEMLH
jgi:hypothetical protein